MKLSHCVCATALVSGCVNAFPSLDKGATLEARQARGVYQFNPPGSQRSPCPGLNTLANHGYINRNGIGITKQQMQQGFLDAFGMGFDATSAGGDNAVNQCSSLTGRTCTSFDLIQLDVPHRIEHDASLSRRDAQMAHDQHADNHSFNQTIWNRSLGIYGATSHIGIKFANTARRKRVEQAEGADFPGWFQEATGGPITEHAFILSTMNDPAFGVNLATPGANPQARMDWVNFWITKMQLPTPLGWQRPSQVITGAQIGSLAAAVSNAPTVTAAVGNSPFIARRKRDLAGADPEPSYNLELNERALEEHYAALPLEKRRKVPLQSIPDIASDPATAPEVANAKAKASAIAGPAPVIPNSYFDVLSPGEWIALSADVQNYTAVYQTALTNTLGQTLPPS